MRKVILNLAVSLDSYIEGPNGEYDWCFADQDYGMHDFFAQIDLIFMGRKSYELINTSGDIYAFPQDKFVFSDTLVPEHHPAVEVIKRADFVTKVNELKNGEGGHIWLFGGADLIGSFLENDLIDEFLLSIHPIILGGGKPLFNGITQRTDLLHTGTKTYNSGLIQARYIRKPKFDTSMLDAQAGFLDN